jgi:hypothetical protein
MGCASVQPELTTLLRDRPPGTTADINRQTVPYWNGYEVRSIRLRDGQSGQLDGDFDFDERTFNQLHADLVTWIAAPRYTIRPELADWLHGANRSNAGR